jgi:hypothetical protein
MNNLNNLNNFKTTKKNAAKKFIAVAVAIVVLASNFALLSFTQTLSPRFEIMSEISPRSAEVGDNVRLSLRFATLGGATTGVRISISPQDGAAVPLTTTTRTVGTMTSGQSSYASFDFNISDKAEAGLYNFTVTISGDSMPPLTHIIGIMLTKPDVPEVIIPNPDISIISASIPPDIKQGEKFEVRAVVRNTGSAAAGNADVKINYPAGVLPLSPETVRLASLGANESREIVFEAIVQENTMPQYYAISLSAEYNIALKGDATEKITRIYNTGILVLSKDKTEPDPDEKITRDFALSARLPESVNHGENFTVSITVTNTGTHDEKNILLRVSPQLSGVENRTANNIIIPELKPGASVTREVVFNAQEAAAGRYCSFELSVSAAGTSDFRQFAGTMIAPLPQTEKEKDARIIIDAVSVPQSVGIGDIFKAEIIIANTGEGDAENIIVSVNMPSGILNRTANTVRIDSIRSGATAAAVFEFIVTQNASYGYAAFSTEASHGADKTGQFFGTVVNSSDLKIEYARLPNSVGINSDFTVEVAIINTGAADTGIVELMLSPSGGGLINKTSNRVSINGIKPGETVVRAFTFMATQSAINGFNPIDISVTHGSETIRQFSGLNVVNPPPAGSGEPNREIPVVIIKAFSFTNIEDDAQPGGGDNFNNNNNNGWLDEPSQVIPVPRPRGLSADDAPGASDFTDLSERRESVITERDIISVMPVMPGVDSDDFGDFWGDHGDGYFGGDYGFGDGGGFGDGFGDGYSQPPGLDPGAVYGGRGFIFDVELLNTHRTAPIRDLKVTISQSAGIFNPRAGANTFFVEYLGPGQTTHISIPLLVKSDAIPDSYPITVTISYRNEHGDPATSTELINIPVRQELRFHIGDLDPINNYNPVEVNDVAFVTVRFGNRGNSLIRNVDVRLQGDGMSSWNGMTHYAGNIPAGQMMSHEFEISPWMAGFLDGMFVFSYEDSDGNRFFENLPFSFLAIGDEEDPWGDGSHDPWGDEGRDVMGPGGEEDGESGGFWLFSDMNFIKWSIIIGGSLLITGGAAAVIIAAVRKRSGNKDDDDDL